MNVSKVTETLGTPPAQEKVEGCGGGGGDGGDDDELMLSEDKVEAILFNPLSTILNPLSPCSIFTISSFLKIRV